MKKSWKLSYYMRGLGTGIVVTALIMGIAMGNKKAPALTDAEIKAAAEKLGMVESNTLKLSDLPAASDGRNSEENGETQGPGEEASEPGSPEGGETPGPGEEASEPGSPENGETPASGERNEASGDNGSSESVSDNQDRTGAEEGGNAGAPVPEEETVTVTVSRGSGSRAICNRLEELGLIEDASGFDQYLIDNGYSKRISVGTYEILVGSDWETIAKIITKSR